MKKSVTGENDWLSVMTQLIEKSQNNKKTEIEQFRDEMGAPMFEFVADVTTVFGYWPKDGKVIRARKTARGYDPDTIRVYNKKELDILKNLAIHLYGE